MKKSLKNQKKKIKNKKNDNVVLFFKEKEDKFLNYQAKMYLYKFRMYIKKNADWVCNWGKRYFKTNFDIKYLMCHFIREFFYKRRREI